MFIKDSDMGNVGMALLKYSEWLNENEPANDQQLHAVWERTRREVWTLRDEIRSHWDSMPSSADPVKRLPVRLQDQDSALEYQAQMEEWADPQHYESSRVR